MMGIKKAITSLNDQTSILPLAIFRMAFGFLMAFSIFRFICKGWVEACYIVPDFHFTYQYFEWVKPLGVNGMYTVAICCALSAIGIGLGLFYRFSSLFFFLSFTYLELIEKSWYLNHYYFVSLMAFLLIWVPANRSHALDCKIHSTLKRNTVPIWNIMIFKLQLCTVYFFGGIAKLKSDWLLEAQPLNIWLKARTDLPLIGRLFEHDIAPFLFSWSGMLYDLIIPFLLWTRKTRPFAYCLVVVFHILTYLLFNIGMFPWLMIFGSLIFITEGEWRQLFRKKTKINAVVNGFQPKKSTFIKSMLFVFLSIQFALPLRHYFLTENVLWSENGFRFAWHVMVMEKNGYVTYTVKDNARGKQWIEYPSERLTRIQEKQMSFQPDMIWQYGKYLEDIYKDKNIQSLSIYVNSKASLNGRSSQTLILKTVDLTKVKNVDSIYDFIVPLNDQPPF